VGSGISVVMIDEFLIPPGSERDLRSTKHCNGDISLRDSALAKDYSRKNVFDSFSFVTESSFSSVQKATLVDHTQALLRTGGTLRIRLCRYLLARVLLVIGICRRI
jgi:hypothetical protein